MIKNMTAEYKWQHVQEAINLLQPKL